MGWINKSMSRKLLAISIVISLVLFTILGSIIGSKINTMMTENAKSELSYEATLIADNLNLFFQKNGTVVEQMATNPDAVELIGDVQKREEKFTHPKFNNIISQLKSIESTDSNIAATWLAIVGSSDLLLSDPTWQAKSDFVITKRPWFMQMEQNDALTFTSPYVDAISGDLVITIVYPVKENGKLTGATGMDLTIGYIKDYLSSFKVGESGYCVLVSNDGTIVYDPDESLIMNQNITAMEGNLGEIGKRMIAGESGIGEYSFNGTDKYMAFVPISTNGWSVGVVIDKSETTAEVRSFVSLISTIFILATIILVFIFYTVTSKGIVSPIRRLTLLTDELAAGNLNIDIDIKSEDEVGHLAKSMKALTARLSTYIDYIDEISSALDELGHGNLNIDLNLDYSGEFAVIKESLLKASSNFKDTLGDIIQIANQVASGSDQVSSASQMLAQATTEQASSLEELSATIDTISQQVTQNAEDSINATNYVKTVGDAANDSQDKMSRMMSAIDEINYKSSEIGKIIKTIDDIAFQTNILALNAAVEAARAGSAGKGFAVVADEVRNLANKSSEAAKNTTILIEDSVKAVQNGTHIAKETGEVLSEVIEGVNKTVELIAGISEASNSQAQAIEQAIEGLEQISSVVHTNSATAEESSASSEELYAQSETLQRLTSKFKI